MANLAFAIRQAQKALAARQRIKSAVKLKPVRFIGPKEHFVPANDQFYVPAIFRDIEDVHARYIGLHGGRGSGKSWYLAYRLVKTCIERPGTRALCVREVQKSIGQSVKRLIEDTIKRLGVSSAFRVLNTHIETPGGGRIDFIGLQNHTAESVKSYEGAKICWIEEAQTISSASLTILRPTIRAPGGAQIWVSYNPRYPDDPIDELFRGSTPPSSMVLLEVNWHHNPFISHELLQEKNDDYNRDPGLADHVWGGGYLVRSEASVITNWRIDNFDMPQWSERAAFMSRSGGMDFGFSIDPAVVVFGWVDVENRKIYLRYEGYKKKLEVDDYPDFIQESVPVEGIRSLPIIADNARPEIISYCARKGYNVKRCRKFRLEESIKFLQSFEIIVHPDCVNIQRELSRYSYKIDKHTEEVLNELLDKDNHAIDAIRYMMEPFVVSMGSLSVPN